MATAREWWRCAEWRKPAEGNHDSLQRVPNDAVNHSEPCFFFFQAEDGIQDHCVTGVQTCALPLSVAVVICGIPAALQQQRYSPILKHEHQHIHVDWPRLGIVFFILIAAIVTNVAMNVKFPESSDHFPFIGASVVIALLLTVPLRRPDWEVLTYSCKGSIFLLSLVTAATMMPVEKLPAASWHTAMGLGFVSAVFEIGR